MSTFILLALARVVLLREEQSADVVVAHHGVESLVVAAVEHREVGQHDMLHPLGVGEEAHHAVVRGVREPRGDGHRLVGGAVDQHVAAVPAAYAVLLHLVVDGDHDHPHDEEQEQAHEEVEHQQHEQIGEHAEDQHQRGAHHDFLARAGKGVLAKVAEGGMPYDYPVAPGHIEHQQRSHERQKSPREQEITLEVRVEKDYGEQNHYAGSHHREEHVHQVDDRGAQIFGGVSDKPFSEDIFHRPQHFFTPSVQ